MKSDIISYSANTQEFQRPLTKALTLLRQEDANYLMNSIDSEIYTCPHNLEADALAKSPRYNSQVGDMILSNSKANNPHEGLD